MKPARGRGVPSACSAHPQTPAHGTPLSSEDGNQEGHPQGQLHSLHSFSRQGQSRTQVLPRRLRAEWGGDQGGPRAAVGKQGPGCPHAQWPEVPQMRGPKAGNADSLSWQLTSAGRVCPRTGLELLCPLPGVDGRLLLSVRGDPSRSLPAP